MKKAPIVLLAALLGFLILIIGIFIGRQSTSGLIMISDNDPSLDHSLYLSEDIADTIPSVPSGEKGKININTASASVLQTLPNIGPVLAQRIVDFRMEYGDYTALEDLMQVKGIGEKTLNEILNYITIGG